MHDIVLRRKNGRFVKVLDTKRSKYAAKQLIPYWESKYDETYDVKIEKAWRRS